MSIVSGSPPAAPASMGGLSSAVEDLSVLPEMNSLRFDGSSYLERNFSQSNRRTMTFSFWSKQSALAISSQIFSTGGHVSDQIFFGNNDIFRIYLSGGYRIETTAVFRDTSAWNHFVITIDTTNSYVRLYQNGAEIATDSIPANTDTKLNDAGTHYISRYAASSAEHFNGYLANIQFIDGQALDPNSFGEWISDIWKPRPYTGDYGVNGFHLDFAGENMVYDSNGKLTQVLDASSNDNHWTAH